MVAVTTGCWSVFFRLIPYAGAPGPMGLSEAGYGLLLTAGRVAGALPVSSIQRVFGRRWLRGLDILGTITMPAVPALATNV